MIGLLFKILNRKQTGYYFLSLFPFDISKLIQQKGSVEGTIYEAGFGLKSAELTLHPAENKCSSTVPGRLSVYFNFPEFT
jgi:hypothetical protein